MLKPAKLNSFLGRLSGRGRLPRAPEIAPDAVAQNIDTILAFYRREDGKIKRSRRSIEQASDFLAQPLYLGVLVLFVSLWMVGNSLCASYRGHAPDEPPFFWLQGLVSLAGLLTSTVVLIKQNRMAKLEAQHAHLDLQVNLLTEQKVTKLIGLMEELRRDLPMVKDREEPGLAAMQVPTDAEAMLANLEEWHAAAAAGPLTPASESATDTPTPRS